MNKAVSEIQAKMKTWTDAGIELAYNTGHKEGYDEGYEADKTSVYDQGYEDGWAKGYKTQKDTRQKDMDMGYQTGLDDAWECARKIYNMTAEETIRVFGGCSNWVNYSASEAIAKIKEYEQTKDDKQDKENKDEKSYIKIMTHNFMGKQYVLYEDVLDLIMQIKGDEE